MFIYVLTATRPLFLVHFFFKLGMSNILTSLMVNEVQITYGYQDAGIFVRGDPRNFPL